MRRFIGGRSTQPEIDALSVVSPDAGTSITHEEVARIAGMEAAGNRFNSVTHRWRRLIERNHPIRIESRDRVFYFLTPNEALERGKGDLHRIGRATGRLNFRVGNIETSGLSAERQAEHSLLAREASALLDSARRSAKAIAVPGPVRPGSLRLAK